MSLTIKITEEQKRLLNKLKIHKRQPYHEVLDYLLEPIKLPSFTAKEQEEFLKKIDRLRSLTKKRMEKTK